MEETIFSIPVQFIDVVFLICCLGLGICAPKLMFSPGYIGSGVFWGFGIYHGVLESAFGSIFLILVTLASFAFCNGLGISDAIFKDRR